MEDMPEVWGYNYPARGMICPYTNKKAFATFVTRLSKNMAATYSPALCCSTNGHERFNFSVRYGKRRSPSAKPP
jgi:hypothetical protein